MFLLIFPLMLLFCYYFLLFFSSFMFMLYRILREDKDEGSYYFKSLIFASLSQNYSFLLFFVHIIDFELEMMMIFKILLVFIVSSMVLFVFML